MIFLSTAVIRCRYIRPVVLYAWISQNHTTLCSEIYDPGPQRLKSLGYICSNSQKYIVWVKIIDFSFMPKIIRTLKGSYDAILKIIILCIWCNRICWHALMFKKHYFSNTVHYCSSSMPRLSQTCSFLQSPSFRQAQSALIGKLTQSIVIGRTPQARIENVMPLTIITSFSFQN